MDNMFNKPYEISLWEDYLNFEVSFLNENNKVVRVENYEEVLPDFTIENPEGYKTSIVQFYKERKICVIGSDTMNTPLRAFNGKFIINTNGSSTLSFSMQYKYYDVDAGILRDNPYVKLLVNERKIKLRYGLLGAKGTKWYDFVIKNVQENSETKTFNYTAKNLFVNELSKSGFNLEFDTELENNQGTIVELGRRVLEGSDWQIPEDFEITLQQTKNEPLYKITLSEAINGINMENNSDIISITAGKEIYGFYTSINEELPFFQFLYREDGIYELDEDYVITNSPNYYIDGVEFIEGQPSFSKGMVVSNEYRGLRLVRKASTTYDKVLDKYVAIYEDENGLEVRGYTEDEYISPVAVSNYVVNSKDFDSLTGWKEGGSGEKDNVIYPTLELKTLPDIFETIYNEDQIFTSYLSINFSNINQVLFNSSVSNYRSQLNGFTEGSKFVFRIKYGIENGETIANTNLELGAKVCKYELVDGVYNILDTYFIFDNLTGDSAEYKYGEAVCIKSMSYSEMTLSKLGLFIYPKNTQVLNNDLLIEEVQLFPYIEDANNQVVFPETIPASGVKKHYLYYYPNSSYEDAEDVEYVYNDTKPATQFKTKYNDESNYQKVRTITARESNRFNLIQDLCELFECWPKFEIEHNELTGEILLDENYRQKKFVTFHEYVGKENDAGFKYGINLKAIQRTIDSEAIVSKIVVKSNQNEYAVDGSCNIARAPENPTGENFVYDFSYYVNQGMLNFNTVNNDLFLETNGYIGYYKKLKRLNKNRDEWIIEQAELLTNQSDLEANLQIYTTSVDQSQELKRDKEIELRLLTGFEFSQFMNPSEETPKEDLDKISDWKKDNATKSICASIARLVNVIERHGALRDMAQIAVDANLARQEELKENLKKIKEEKLALEIQFYKKYSRFIQEGSWIDENYVDDNLYYLDAESTLHTSSQPKITYTINVLELSQIPGYENYSFNVGDKTYMEDIEFFGWKQIEGIQTPRKEEILINEITIALDSPEQNQIKVQNYKTQFEDLFQRITATTQNVEYSTGKYNKVTSIVETDGTIKVNTLQNSMANNSLIISNAKDQSVIWDETGITTTSLSSPNEVVRIVSGGIFLSTDGGVNWNTGISGKGINANYITTGQLDTSVVQILAGAFPSFRWDSVGLSAYEFELAEDKKSGKNFNYSKFIRFDQFGLYGIKGFANFNPLEETEGLSGEDKIWKYADFALTWKGFQLKNRYGNGYVSIDSKNDFVVSDGKYNRIKIGNLGNANEPLYGIRIANAHGAPVMETNDDGTLWLKDELHIGTKDTSTVKIGYLEETRKDTEIHEVIHAGDTDTEFIVYEDGKMKATGAEFTGTIYATGGQIGNMAIGDVEATIQQSKKLDIISILGYNFKVRENIAYPSQLELEAKPVGFELDENSIKWSGSGDFENWKELEGKKTCILTYDIFNTNQNNDTYYIKIEANSTEGTVYKNWITIMAVYDGEKGEDALTLVIVSTKGNYFRNNSGSTTLIAKLFKAGREIDAYEPYEYNYTWRDLNNSSWSSSGKTLEVTANDIDFSRTYVCDVSKGGE